MCHFVPRPLPFQSVAVNWPHFFISFSLSLQHRPLLLAAMWRSPLASPVLSVAFFSCIRRCASVLFLSLETAFGGSGNSLRFEKNFGKPVSYSFLSLLTAAFANATRAYITACSIWHAESSASLSSFRFCSSCGYGCCDGWLLLLNFVSAARFMSPFTSLVNPCLLT